jgi:hypothetical protein
MISLEYLTQEISWEHNIKMFLRYTAVIGFPTGFKELGGHQV